MTDSPSWLRFLRGVQPPGTLLSHSSQLQLDGPPRPFGAGRKDGEEPCPSLHGAWATMHQHGDVPSTVAPQVPGGGPHQVHRAVVELMKSRMPWP